MKKSKVYMALRILLGLALIFFGINGLFELSPMPEMNEQATKVIMAFVDAGYILRATQIVFLITGLGLLLNKWAALSAVILLPISINIVLFHLFLEPAGSLVGIIVLLLNLYILCVNKDKFKPLLSAN